VKYNKENHRLEAVDLILNYCDEFAPDTLTLGISYALDILSKLREFMRGA